MKKTVNYVVRTTENAITHETQTVPVVVNRREPVDLVDVVANCIDRNLILGAKPTAAQGIAEGIAEQLAFEFRRGNGVKFGKYFYGRLYLNGTTNQNGDLTDENGVNVRLYKGEDFKLGLDDFSFSFVNGGDLPDVEFCVGRGDGVKNVLDAGNDLVIYGTNLWYAEDASIKVLLTSEDGTVVEVGGDAIASKSADLLVVGEAAVAGLGLTNARWTVSVQRTTGDGRKLYGKSGHVQCAGFEPAPGPEPLAQTSDGKCRVMSFTDGGSAEEFTFGDPWKLEGAGLYGSGEAPEGEWEATEAYLDVGGDEVGLGFGHGEDGTVATLEDHGEALPGTYENVTLTYKVARGGVEETLTLTIPTLVVA